MLDLWSDDETIANMYEYFKIDYKDEKQLIAHIVDKYNIINKYMDNPLKIIYFEDLKINDHVKLTYMTYSQRHMPNYESIEGIVIYVNKKTTDGLIFCHDENGIMIKSIIRESCGNGYSHSRGYEYIIHLFIKKI